MIKSGHIAAKLPCDASSTSPLKILIGQAPNLKPAALELVKPLSTLLLQPMNNLLLSKVKVWIT
jgi:hypothetical protein